MGAKICTACDQSKPLSEFYAQHSALSAYTPRCKPCIRAYNKARREVTRLRERERYGTDSAYRARKIVSACKQVEVRRARMSAAPSDGTWPDRAGGDCALCPAPAASRDHIHPLAAGGHHALHNYQPLCEPCNKQKHSSLGWCAADCPSCNPEVACNCG